MIIVCHRVNTIKNPNLKIPKVFEEIGEIPTICKGLEEISEEYGVEIDIRERNGELILHHDAFHSGELLKTYLEHYQHKLLIANIKTEGIERRVIQLLEEKGIQNYFLLDVTPPFMFKLMTGKLTGKKFSKIAIRASPIESFQMCMNILQRDDVNAEWLFIDPLDKFLPLTPEIYRKIKDKIKICVVSPELLNRPKEIVEYQKYLRKNGIKIDCVLTDVPNYWKDFSVS